MSISKNTKTICLVMIVKDEAVRMPRCLKYVKNYIDTYCIVDTGSKDDTIEIIKKELKGIPGTVHRRPWKNFGHNRTEALQLAFGMSDYIILSDADEQLVFSENFDKNALEADAYFIKYEGDLDYRVPYLFKNSGKFYFEGVTHEYLACKEKYTYKNLDTVRIVDYGDGGNKQNKFIRDIELLTKDLEKNPRNARSMFYLANSYMGIQDYRNAIIWYKERIKAGGWKEEVACSYLNLGRCYYSLKEFEKALSVWLEGYEYYPSRAECLYSAIKLLREQKKYRIAYALAKIAETIPYPEKDILFIEKPVYEWKIPYEISILAYYADKNRDVRTIYRDLLQKETPVADNIISNYKFYVKSLKPFEIFSKELSLADKGWVSSTPCIIKDKDGYIVNVRNVTYKIDKQTGNYSSRSPEIKKINTQNVYVKLDFDFNIIETRKFEVPDFETRDVNGIEDIKICNGRFIGSLWKKPGEIKIVEGIYNTDSPVLEYSIIESPYGRPVEKNWAPFEHEGKIKYIYSWEPLTVGTIKNKKFEIEKISNVKLPRFRGSSPGCRFGNELYFLVHFVEFSAPRKYYHAIVVLDYKTLAYKRHSVPFTFEDESIEFALGLIVENERVIITHSTWDETAKIKVYDKKALFNDIKI